MYLAKFFHRAPGDNDKELLFIPGDEPIVMGIHMHGDEKIGEDEFLREEFSDIRAAVTVFRRHAAELAAAGYMETTHTRYTLRNLLPDPAAEARLAEGPRRSDAGRAERAAGGAGKASCGAARHRGRAGTALSLARGASRLFRRSQQRQDHAFRRAGPRYARFPPRRQDAALRLVDPRERTGSPHLRSVELGASARRGSRRSTGGDRGGLPDRSEPGPRSAALHDPLRALSGAAGRGLRFRVQIRRLRRL